MANRIRALLAAAFKASPAAKTKLTMAALLGAAVVSTGGFAAHRFALDHVAYYTGDVPRELNCVSCHIDARGGTIVDRILRPRYKSPLRLALCGDGSLLLATAQDSDSLLMVDPAAGQVVAEVPVGRHPSGVAVNRSCTTAYVANEDSDNVSVVDLRGHRVQATLPAGMAPNGVALGPDERRLFVTNWIGHDVSVVDLAHPGADLRLTAGNSPTDLALSPDGKTLLVANELSRIARFPTPPVTEVTALDPARDRVVARHELFNAHLVEGVAFAPEGDLALFPAVRPKNLLPALQVERGWMMTNGLAVLDMKTGDVTQVPLDEVGAFYADPTAVAITPDGSRAFVSHGGVDLVSAVDLPALRRLVREASPEKRASYGNNLGLSRRFVLRRIPVGNNPTSLAVSPDGKLVYVAERLNDTIGVIDTRRLERVREIDLGGPRHLTLERLGERVFNNSRVTLQHQFTCKSCHPHSHSDHLQYDFEPDGLGTGIVDNRTLLGIRDTGPFKWNGKNTSLYMQCGIRFARFLTRSQPFSVEDLNALVAYYSSLKPMPNRWRLPDGRLTPAQARGKAIFMRTVTRTGQPIPVANRCITCHTPPFYTDRRKFDVGTTSPFDHTPWDSGKEFDTPQLNDIALSPPYLHDGKAQSLEEIWTLYSPEDKHGMASDLGKDGLNDLIEYLKTL
jgi:YVTN family beta-propeller protein